MTTGFPEESFRAWVGGRLPGAGPFDVTSIGGGRANDLFRVARGSHAWVVKRQRTSPDAVNREAIVLDALSGSRVPHAPAMLTCFDDTVLGAPFLVLPYLDGVCLHQVSPPPYDAPDGRRKAAFALVEALAALHHVDWRSTWAVDLGDPSGYTERQPGVWIRRWERSRTRPIPDLDRVGTLLAASIPKQTGEAIVHGDPGLHNALFAAPPNTRLLALVDWETATLGDPLADLGYLLGAWVHADEQERWPATAPAYPVDGYPTRDELAAHYEACTGTDLSDLAWFRALGQFKIAVILEAAYARIARTNEPRARRAELAHMVPNIAAHALAIATGEE